MSWGPAALAAVPKNGEHSAGGGLQGLQYHLAAESRRLNLMKHRRKLNTRVRDWSKPRAYQGTLYVEESEEEVRVSRFIVRQGEIAFDLSAIAIDESANWRFSGTATLAPSGRYVSPEIEGTLALDRSTTEESIPTKFAFEVPKQSSRGVQVRGWWIAGGERCEFSGELKPLKAAKR